jgi:hypothetical protein
MVRVSARSQAVAPLDARVIQRAGEHELEMERVAADDNAAEICRRPQQDHRFHGNDRVWTDRGKRVLKSRKGLLHGLGGASEMRIERAHGAGMLAGALAEAPATHWTPPACFFVGFHRMAHEEGAKTATGPAPVMTSGDEVWLGNHASCHRLSQWGQAPFHSRPCVALFAARVTFRASPEGGTATAASHQRQ